MKEKAKRQIIDYRMIWRWHFYTGLICIPFTVILSLTGPIYLFKPQIEAAIDRRYDALAFSGQPQSMTAQVRAAEAANPGWRFKAVEVRQDSRDAARVTLVQGGDKLRVYVHPHSLAILKQVPEEARFMSVVKTIHGELVSGRVGEVIVELAACWAIVMILTGLYLWWPRNAEGMRGVLWPRLNAGSRIFWRDIHAVTGIYVSGLALVLLISGLPWTYVWGNGFKAVRNLGQLAASAPKQDWSQGRTEEARVTKTEGAEPVALDRLDPVIDMVRALDMPPPVVLAPPSPGGHLWSAQSNTGNRPQRVTYKIMADSLEIVSREDFAAKKPLDKVVGVGIALHEGQLFGWLNQALGVLAAMGLLTLCLSAVVMWWKRRPVDSLGAPTLLPDEKLGTGLAVLIVCLAIFLPVLGISLIIIGLIEQLILRRIPVARRWLGLKSI